MSDALRDGRHFLGDAPERERAARIEELLLTGLDHYFAGEYELAINVWTRVLFLDRSHARARAYIERARGAVAERQREADELLQNGAAALHRGDRHTARDLLTSAERAGGSEEALALLSRLDMLDAAAPLPESSSRGGAPDAPARPSNRQDARLPWVIAGLTTGVLLAGSIGAYMWWSAEPVSPVVPVLQAPAVRVPPICEIRLFRARTLLAEKRLHEALAVLDQGDPDGLHRATFAQLRAAIQQDLIAAGRRDAGVAAAEPLP